MKINFILSQLGVMMESSQNQFSNTSIYEIAFTRSGTAIILIEEDMTISLINDRVVEITGYTREEIEGKQKWPLLVAPEDRGAMLEYHVQRRVNPQADIPTEYEFRYRHKDGTLSTALAVISLIKETKQSLISLIDISDRKGIEQKLLESEARFRNMANFLPSIICEIDRNLRVTYVNKIGLSRFGFTERDLKKGVYATDIIHESRRSQAAIAIYNWFDGKKNPPDEYLLQHNDGSFVPYLISADSIIDNGEIVGVRTCIIDISDRKKVEFELRRSQKQMETLFAHSPYGIALFSEEGKLLKINEMFGRLFSLPIDVNCNDVEVSLFEQIISHKNIIENLQKNKEVQFESDADFRFIEVKDTQKYQYVETGDRVFDWAISLLVIEEHAESTNKIFLVQGRDITERKALEYKKINTIKRRVDKANRLAAGLKEEIIERSSFCDMVSKSHSMQRIFQLLPDAAHMSTSVLITGESGTGKELVARSIHSLSPRKEKPFITLNCGALPDTLLESELFGHTAGAFTDAKKDKAGKFILADKGTLFLDEIGEISPAMQVKLLRVLQEQQVDPLGSSSPVSIDVRIIAATHKNLKDMIADGTFREDLYYRINVLNVHLPPLRERKCDITLLADYFIKRFNKKYQKEILELSSEALSILLAHDYPGNIRELENIIEHSFIFCRDETIEANHLPSELRNGNENGHESLDILNTVKSLEELERMYISHILKKFNGNRGKTADFLKIHKTTLFRKMKALSLD